MPDEGARPGLFERAKRAFGLSKDTAAPAARAERVTPAPAAAAPAAADGALGFEEERSAAVPATGEDIGGMFARQLASGLWEGADGSDAGRLAATTACLVRCVREGIDTSNPIYGAQVTKAVDALSTAAESLAQKGQEDAALIRALLAMAAVSTGKRARARVAAIATAAASAAVKAIVAELGSQESAKKKLG